MLAFWSFQPCMDQEKFFIPPIEDTHAYDIIVEDDITYS